MPLAFLRHFGIENLFSHEKRSIKAQATSSVCDLVF